VERRRYREALIRRRIRLAYRYKRAKLALSQSWAGHFHCHAGPGRGVFLREAWKRQLAATLSYRVSTKRRADCTSARHR